MSRRSRALASVVGFAVLATWASFAVPARSRAGTYTFAPVAWKIRARGDVRRASLRFDVHLPAGERVVGATLRLWRMRARRHHRGKWAALDVRRSVRGPGVVGLAVSGVAPSWRRHAPRLVVRTASPGAPTRARPPSPDPPAPARRPPLPPPPLLVGPGLHTTPHHAFVARDGTPISLKGLNVVPVWRDSPGRTWERARYEQIRAKGFNVVRFVLYWRDFEPQSGAFDATSLRTLDTAVARAREAGLWVILDEIHLWVLDGALQGVPAWAWEGDSVSTVAAHGAGFVRMLADRYRDEPAVAAYDPVNEPHRFPIDPDGVLRMYDTLIAAIRAADPYKIVLVEPSLGDSSAAGDDVDFALLRDRRNVVWSPHDYFAGGEDDGYDSTGWQSGAYTWDGNTGYTMPNRSQLAAHLDVQLAAAAQASLPVWIGEFGIGADAANRDAWIADQVALFDAAGLGYAWWEYHSASAFSATAADFSWQPWIDVLAPAAAPPGPG